jgi:maleylpyruvate isomerase
MKFPDMSVVEIFEKELAASTDALLSTAALLGDADVAGPSLLPGWSRGHVLTHLARNADSLINLLTWARSGIVTPQYPDPDARTAQIQAGAARPAAGQLADLADSAARLNVAVRDVPPQRWSALVGDLAPPRHPAWYVLVRRLREVEVHHVDLNTAYGTADWPATFVRRELHDCLASWRPGDGGVSEIRFTGGPAWTGLGRGPVVEGTPHQVLAWLTGRPATEGIRVVAEGSPGAPGLAGPPPWPAMTAPSGLPATPPPAYPAESDS